MPQLGRDAMTHLRPILDVRQWHRVRPGTEENVSLCLDSVVDSIRVSRTIAWLQNLAPCLLGLRM